MNSSYRFKHYQLSKSNNLTLCIGLNKEERKVKVGFSIWKTPRFQNPEVKKQARQIAYDFMIENNLSFNTSESEITSDSITFHSILEILSYYLTDEDIRQEVVKLLILKVHPLYLKRSLTKESVLSY